MRKVMLWRDGQLKICYYTLLGLLRKDILDCRSGVYLYSVKIEDLPCRFLYDLSIRPRLLVCAIHNLNRVIPNGPIVKLSLLVLCLEWFCHRQS